MEAVSPSWYSELQPIVLSDLTAWAELSYPAFFGGPNVQGVHEIYQYRGYPQTGNFVGLTGNSVYLLGPLTGGAVQYMGSLTEYACLARPDLCETSRPLSALQAQWEAIGAAGFSQITASSASSPSEYFVYERSSTSSAAAAPSRTATTAVTQTLPFVGGPPVPAAYGGCRSSWYSIHVDDQGNFAQTCFSADWRVQFIGDAVYYSALATNGRGTRKFLVTALTETALDGLNVADHLRTAPSYSLSTLTANSAVFPAGATVTTISARQAEGYMLIRNANWTTPTDVHLVTSVSASGGFSLASTVEQALPFNGQQLASGSIMLVNGRRTWVSNLVSSNASSCLTEISGRVYNCTYYRPWSVAAAWVMGYNAIARDAIVNAGLRW